MEAVVAKVPSAMPSAVPPPPVRFYDTLMFFEELDVLRARLETVYPHVYRIVICEAGQMHCRGQPKPFHLEAAWDSFAAFHDKMVYIKLPAFPERYADFPPHLRAMKAEDAKAATETETETERCSTTIHPVLDNVQTAQRHGFDLRTIRFDSL